MIKFVCSMTCGKYGQMAGVDRTTATGVLWCKWGLGLEGSALSKPRARVVGVVRGQVAQRVECPAVVAFVCTSTYCPGRSLSRFPERNANHIDALVIAKPLLGLQPKSQTDHRVNLWKTV
jgi:hypothetical protein